MAKYTPMIQQYLSIKADYPDAFLFFRMGDFYELFFDDAKRAAKELEITLTGRDGGKERIPMCGVPHHSVEVYISRLIEKGYKVALCEQVEDPASAKGVVRREVVRVITPGTVMDEKMLVDKENNFLTALIRRQERFALAAGDLSTGEFYVTEFSGSVESLIDELASFQPREVLMSPELSEDTGFQEQLRIRLKCLVTVIREDHVIPQPELEKRVAAQFPDYQEACTTPFTLEVTGLLLGYLQGTQKRTLGHLNRLSRYDTNQYMVLDESARHNLELTTTLREGKKRGSLLWLLDRTATAMGSRLLKKWLDKPLLDKKAIEERQDAIEAFMEDPILLDEVRDHLKCVYDLERLSARIAYGSANGRDLISICRSLQVLPDMMERLSESGNPVLKEIPSRMDLCQDVVDLVHRAIVEDPPVSVKEGGIIQEGHDEELDRLRSVQQDGRGWITRMEQQERKATGIKSLKVGFNKVFGYYIEVTKANLRLLPEGRYQRKQTLANAERFVTPELKEQERLILEAEEKSVELEYQLFTRIREQVARQISRIQQVSDQVARLDVLHAFADISSRQGYVRPLIFSDDRLIIEEGRHPVVEAAVGDFVANDTRLDNKTRQVLMITGPNMAGKSTYMRQVALIGLMAQVGCFVPARKAELGIIDRIFTRIGAADDLVGGRSTFMVEMDETRSALAQATTRSLILLDEVGRGTSTYDGMALAQAIVEYLHDHVGAKTLFSTHYHELTQLEQELPRVVNVHARCVEKDGEVVFLHRIEAGGADKSYGIHVAQLAGMPPGVIQRAEVLLESLEKRSASEQEAQQMELFRFPAEAAPTKEIHLSSREREVLQSLSQWDMFNRTPMETIQFLLDLQHKLKEAQSSMGGGLDGKN
ncbi:DNA mismatch repair protein MutS [Kroppenstedtia pulmonis]|uniref:DNA mismatch repair protein MutS n=1 Tax=Kroppenstedtia pulmonis TaxID=1380685 RepID=A0A7D3XMQ2_9BACL|nr:DNA mismatch repair protein MutS [Kroppenstedtia pulmonis]QKG84509.1 DNA mismatch repair protein MutS [Kroppenstedtia pulmonis]